MGGGRPEYHSCIQLSESIPSKNLRGGEKFKIHAWRLDYLRHFDFSHFHF